MFKKIGIFSIILLSFTVFISACKKPYENLSLELNVSEVVLYLNSSTNNSTNEQGDETGETGNVSDPSFPNTASVLATVSGAKKGVSTDVVFAQDGNVVDVETSSKNSNVTTLKLTAKNAGDSIVTIQTKEGNKRKQLKVKVYTTVNSVAFNEQTISKLAISTTLLEYNQVNLNSHVTYSPNQTNQKDMNFYIADSSSNPIKLDDLGFVVENDYAKIENGILTIKNESLAPLDATRGVRFVPVVGYSRFKNELTTSKFEGDVLKVPILNLITQNQIQLLSSSDSGNLELTKNAQGQYEIVLGSNVNNIDIFKRTLTFKMNVVGNNVSTDKNYRVSAPKLSGSENNAVVINEKTNHNARQIFNPIRDDFSKYNFNSFEISTNNAQETSFVVNFLVDYYNFEGTFTITVPVKITIKKFPTSLEVRNREGSILKNNDVIDVYNQYGGSLIGERITVKANPEIAGAKFKISVLDGVRLIVKDLSGNVVNLATREFVSGDSVYLVHDYEQDAPTSSVIRFSFEYSLSPSASVENQYKKYVVEHSLKINYKIGLTKLDVLESMKINITNKTLVIKHENGDVETTTDLVLLNLSRASVSVDNVIKDIRIDRFNGIKTNTISEFNINPIDNEFYTLQFDLQKNQIIVVPNSTGLNARFNLIITTHNNISAEVELVLFVPLAFEQNEQAFVEVLDPNGIIFEQQQVGYNLSVSDDNSIVVKKAIDQNGVEYDADGHVKQVGDDEFVALQPTYFTTTDLNFATNSFVALNFYNFILNQDNTSIERINYAKNVKVRNFSSSYRFDDYFDFVTDENTSVSYLHSKNQQTQGVNGLPVTFEFSGYSNDGTYLEIRFVLNVKVTRAISGISITPSSSQLYEYGSVGEYNKNQSRASLSILPTPNVNINSEHITKGFELSNSTVYTHNILVSPTATIVDGIENLLYVKHISDFINQNGLNGFIHVNQTTGLVSVSFMASDFVSVSQVGQVNALIQESFYNKFKLIFQINNYYNLHQELLEHVLISQEFLNLQRETISRIYENNINVRIIAKLAQYNKYPYYAYADVTIKYAKKVSNIIVGGVDNEGLYFDVRNSNLSSKRLSVYALPYDASNRNLIASIEDNSVARIVSGINSQGVITGSEIVIESLSAGTTKLVITSQDSYVKQTVLGQEVLVAQKQVSFRIKVADGSQENPFEIRNETELFAIGNNSNYYYVIAKDITITRANYAPIKNFSGGINGLFTYYASGIYFEKQNTIYGFTINVSTLNDGLNLQNPVTNIGLFENLKETALIENLSLKNVNIKIYAHDENQTKTLSVGAVAGQNNGILNNVSVEGVFEIDTNLNNVSVGGLVGVSQININLQNETHTGYIANTRKDAVLNSNVLINLISEKDINTQNNSNKNLGGVVGLIETNAIDQNGNSLQDFNLIQQYNNLVSLENLNANATINSYYGLTVSDVKTFELNLANIGGLVGFAKNILVSNVVTSVNLKGVANIGGVAGRLENATVYNAVVESYNKDIDGLGSASIIGNTNLGGLVGIAKNLSLNYSYFRSYINQPINNQSYFGDIVLLNGENNVEEFNDQQQLVSISSSYVGGLVGQLENVSQLTHLYVNENTGQIVQAVSAPSELFVKVSKKEHDNEINNSYFNANINTFASNGSLLEDVVGDVFVGGLVGGIVQNTQQNQRNSLLVEDSYVLANIVTKNVVLKQDDEETVEVTEIPKLGTVTNTTLLKRNEAFEGVNVVNENVNTLQIETIENTAITEKLDENNNPTGVYELTRVVNLKLVRLFGNFVGNEFKDFILTQIRTSTDPITNDQTISYENKITSEISGLIKTSYSLINSNQSDKEFVGIENTSNVYHVFTSSRQEFDKIVSQTHEQTQNFKNIYYPHTYNEFKNTYDFNIALSTDFDEQDYVWVSYDGLNDNMPVLVSNLNPNKLLFKLLPTNFTAKVIDVDNSSFNNLQFFKINDGHVVLFNNKVQGNSNRVPVNNNKYQIIVKGQVPNVQTVMNVIEVDLNVNIDNSIRFIPEIDGNLVITSSNSQVVRVLNDNVIETMSNGKTTLTIMAKLNNSIKTQVEVLVVDGFSHFEISGNNKIVEDKIYVDSTNFNTINQFNNYTIDPFYATYAVNKNVGYVVSLVGTIDDSERSASVMLNNMLLEFEKQYVFENLINFNLKGVLTGQVTLSIVPFIKTNTQGFGQTILGSNAHENGQQVIVENAVMLDFPNVTKNYTFEVVSKAKEITTNNKTLATISPSNSTQVVVSVVTSSFDSKLYNQNKSDPNFKINSNNIRSIVYEQLRLEVYDLKNNLLFIVDDIRKGASAKITELVENSSLISINYGGFTYNEITSQNGKVLELKLNYIINLSFNAESFRSNVINTNYNLNEQNYKLKFIPLIQNVNAEFSNVKFTDSSIVSAEFNLNIQPNSLDRITASFYAGNEYDENSEESFNPGEVSTELIAPGKTGLLKLYLFPEFNDAEFVEVTVDGAMTDYVTFEQMLEVYDENGFVTGYTSTGYNTYPLPNNTGIRLRNLSNIKDDKVNFTGAFFVRVNLSMLAQANNFVNIKVTPYKTVNGAKTAMNLVKDISLQIQPLPRVSIDYNGKKQGNIAIGTQIDLNVLGYNLDQAPTINAISLNGNSAFNSLETIYNEKTGKYSLKVNDNAKIGDTIRVYAHGFKTINDFKENAQDYIDIEVVEFIIESIYLEGTSSTSGSNTSLELLNGTNNELSIKVNAIYSPTALNGTISESIKLFEDILSGKELPTNTNSETYINFWKLQTIQSGVVKNEGLILNNTYGNVFKFIRETTQTFNPRSYFAISALKVSSGIYTLSFDARFYYDATGKVQPFTQGIVHTDVKEVVVPMYNFTLYIKDNSTLDHPNPISTVQEFNAMQEGVNYILVNDITLNDHEPFVANFASLDGNGYVVNINKFNTQKYYTNANPSTIETGLFETISSNTLIKNLTINISGLLTKNSEVDELINLNSTALNQSSKINLTGVSLVTFGVLAGQNNGTVTNVKVVNLDNASTNLYDKMLFVNTTHQFINNAEVVGQIGGLVGVNNGSISNSYVGQNYNTLNSSVNGESTISRVVNGVIASVPTYNFALAGSKQIAGVMFTNGGVVSNVYNKEVAIVNTGLIAENNKTAGFVVNNNGRIFSSFVEGSAVTNLRATSSIYLEGKGYIGGFVYSNNSQIKDSYSNIFIKQNSSGSGGFVFENNDMASIQNAYSASNNNFSNSWAHGAFTGLTRRNEFKNLGTYNSVFYLVFEHETPNTQEPAEAIVGNNSTSTAGDNPFRYQGSFSEFSFASTSSSTENGIWLIGVNGNYGPQIATIISENVFSYRVLESITNADGNEENIVHNYRYISEHYGSKNNPVLITGANEFLNVVIGTSKSFTYKNASNVIERINVFGVNNATVNSASNISHIRLVNNLSFSSINLNEVVVNGLRISDIMFAGVLDGNNFAMLGISLVDLKKDQINENYGFFNQIGVSNEQYLNYINKSATNVALKTQNIKPAIKNLSFSIGRFDATNSIKVGALAGSIYDSNLINITLNGVNNVVVQGRNLVGGMAGLIKFEQDNQEFTVSGLVSNNVWISSAYRGTEVNDYDHLTENGRMVNVSGSIRKPLVFKSLYLDGTSTTALRNYSYAGGIAGAIIGSNWNKENLEIKQNIVTNIGNSLKSDITYARSEKLGKISNITVSGGGRVVGEQVGGLFGFVGQNTHIMKSSYHVSSLQGSVHTLQAYNYAGAIVGENYGFLEKVTVENDKESQTSYDANIANGSSQVQGINSLFGTQVSVAIGGIAGYSHESMIIDSYVKVNVVNPLSRIAGGLIGLATGENYISHSFVTSNVFAKKVFGGVVGLYNQSGKGIVANRDQENPSSISQKDDNKLLLDYVVALNTWGASSKNAVYDNLKEYYKNGSNYFSFNLVFSEVGNHAPNITTISEIVGTISPEQEATYKPLQNTLTPQTFVGSLVGQVSLNTKTVNDYYNKTINSETHSNQNMLTTSGILKAVNVSRKVKTINSETFVANIASTLFDGENVVQNNHIKTNQWPTQNNASVKGDIISYDTIVGYQNTNENILGVRTGSNYFNSWTIDEEELRLNSVNDSQVWRISTKNKKLPEFVVGVYSNYITINSMQSLQEKLISVTATEGKFYILKHNTDVGSGGNYEFTNPTLANIFNNSFKGTIIGEAVTVNGVSSYPTIKVNINGSAGSVFKQLQSATITNVNFEINLLPTNGVVQISNNNLTQTSVGLIAREMQDSIFVNVSVKLTSINNNGGSNSNVTLKLMQTQIKDMGLVFGNVYNSTIENIDLEVVPNITLDSIISTYINNIGVLIGHATDSQIRNVNVATSNKTFTVNLEQNENTTINIGGLIGLVDKNLSYSSISNTNQTMLSKNNALTNMNLKVLKANENVKLYVGGIVGYTTNINIDSVSYFGNISVGENLENNYVNSQTFVGGIAGFIGQKSIITDVFVNSYYTTSSNGKVNYNLKTNNSKPYDIKVHSNNLTFVGGLVGQMQMATISSSENDINTNSSTAIFVENNSTKNTVVGGIVGNVIGTSTIEKVLSLQNINVTAKNQTKLIVGGILGMGDQFTIDKVYVYGDIIIDTTIADKTLQEFNVGGIVGQLTGSSQIKNYVVYGDIYNNINVNISQNRLIAGVVGNSNGTLTITNGMVLSHIKGIKANGETQLTYVNAFVNGKLQVIEKSYYIYELIPYNVVERAGAVAVAYQDMLELNSSARTTFSIPGHTINTITGEKLTNEFSLENVEKIPTLKGLTSLEQVDTLNGNKLFKLGGKFNTANLTQETIADAQFKNANNEMTGYFALNENIILTSAIDKFNGILIGKKVLNSTGANYSTITMSSNEAFIKENLGIVVNIAVKVPNFILNDSAYFAHNNAGYLINIASFGDINVSNSANGNFAGLVYNNNGTIKFGASNLVINTSLTNSNKGFAGIVFNNNVNGYITESYSNSLLLNDANLIKVALLSYTNNGRIKSSYFGGYVKNNNLIAGIITGSAGLTDNKTSHVTFDSSINNYQSGLGTSTILLQGASSIVKSWTKMQNMKTPYTNAYKFNEAYVNYGYPSIANGIEIYSNFTIDYNKLESSDDYLKVAGITGYFNEPTTKVNSVAPIYNVSQLIKISSQYNTSKEFTGYILLKDIVLDNAYVEDLNSTENQVNFIPYINELKAKTLFGNNKTIKSDGGKFEIKGQALIHNMTNNAKISYLNIENVKVVGNAILVKEMESGVIKDVKIKNFAIKANSDMVGAVVGKIEVTNVSENVLIKNIDISSNGSFVYGAVYDYVGGAFGFINGNNGNPNTPADEYNVRIDSVTLNGITIGTRGEREKASQINFYGGFAGRIKYAKVTKINIYETFLNSFVGTHSKIVNEKTFGENESDSIKFIAHYNLNHIGGMAGTIISSEISDIIVLKEKSGTSSSISSIRGTKYMGGIAGAISNTTAINLLVSYDITGVYENLPNNLASYIGGFFGSMVNSSFNAPGINIYTGTIFGKYAVGGAVGTDNDSYINNVYIQAIVKGEERIGGIIGEVAGLRNNGTRVSNVDFDGYLEWNGSYSSFNGDIDKDWGVRKIKIGASNYKTYDAGPSNEYYSYLGIMSNANDEKNKGEKRLLNSFQTTTFGGKQDYFDTFNNTFRLFMGLKFGHRSSTVSESEITIERQRVNGVETKGIIKNIVDMYTTYRYIVNEYRDSGWFSKAKLTMSLTVTISKSVYSTNYDSSFHYGGIKNKWEKVVRESNEMFSGIGLLVNSHTIYSGTNNRRIRGEVFHEQWATFEEKTVLYVPFGLA